MMVISFHALVASFTVFGQVFDMYLTNITIIRFRINNWYTRDLAVFDITSSFVLGNGVILYLDGNAIDGEGALDQR
jgi:hypothetical protein